MRRSRILVLTLIGLSTASLALAYGLSRQWVVAVSALGLGSLWALAQWRRPTHPTPAEIAFVLFTGGAGFGVLLELPAALLLVAALGALGAWDLHHWISRVLAVDHVEAPESLERLHLIRLGWIGAGGLVLGGLGMAVRVRLGFTLAAALALVAFWGIAQAVRYLRTS